MENYLNSDNIDALVNKGKTSKWVKVVAFILVAIILIYASGKVMHVFAHTIRGYNNLKSACNGS